MLKKGSCVEEVMQSNISSHERHLEEEEESTPYAPPPAAVPDTASPYLEPTSSLEPEPSSEISVEPSSKPFCEAETTDVNLFYPNWDWEVSSCVNDGDEPDYMAVHPTDWLFSTKSACCEKWIGGAPYDECMGDDDCNEDEYVYEALFYPDWEDTMSCINDGKEPYYMQMESGHWMKNTREECCKRFFEWEYFDCIGTEPPASDEYYPDWSSNWDGPTCVNDGEMPQYMLRLSIPSSLHPTLEECCKKHFGKACMGPSFVAPDVKWYVDWFVLPAGKCIQDCNGEWPLGVLQGHGIRSTMTKKHAVTQNFGGLLMMNA